MNPELKALLDKYATAGASDDELRQVAADWQTQHGSGADDGSSLSLGNMARVAGLGATFGLGKSTALPENVRIDGAKADAFKKEHPLGNFALKMLGGAAAPIAAVAAAPEVLGGLAGTMALGGTAGMLDAAGEDSDKDMAASERSKHMALGAGLGTAGGAAGYGVSRFIGSSISAVLDRVHPERVLAREASKIVRPVDLARMNEANAIAPGSASLATSTLPTQITAKAQPPRFTSDVRGVGAAADRGMGAEAQLVAQKQGIEAGKRAIGAKMDALPSQVPSSPQARRVMQKVSNVLGKAHAPDMPDGDYRLVTELSHGPLQHPDPATLPHATLDAMRKYWQSVAELTSTRQEPEQLHVQSMRDALGRLRYLARNADKRGTEMNGPTAYDIKDARNALQDYLHNNVRGIADLDRQYAKLMEQHRACEPVARTAQRSIERHSAAATAGADAGSVGGTLLKGKLNLAKQILGKMTGGKTNSVMSPKMAAAVSKYLLTPGDASTYARLLTAGKPFSPAIQRSGDAATTAITPALRSLLNLYPVGFEK